MRMRSVVGQLVVVGLALSVLAGDALAQTVQLSVESREIYAEVPFTLSVSARGFDEQPPPPSPNLAIAGCKVDFIGMSPSVSRSISIVNGRTTQTRDVSFVYRYRVTAPKAGTYRVPEINIEQASAAGTKKASSRSAQFKAEGVQSSHTMKLALVLPERTVYVGETFEVYLDWLLQKDPNRPSFAVPLFHEEEWVEVQAPEPKGRRTFDFPIGGRDLAIPYDAKVVSMGGQQYTRLRFVAQITPKKAGKLELSPAKVVAALEVGSGRDRFGFPVVKTELFRAGDVARTLEIRPLPLTGQPKSFAGAVGESFSLEVTASRTVVRVGDPIEMIFVVRGDTDLSGVSLPPLSGPGRLPPKQFSVPDERLAGELIDDGKAKQFVVTARLMSADVTAIPAIEFGYFNAAKGAYEVARSQPIALSVAGSSVVGSSQVVGQDGAGAADVAAGSQGAGASVLADLTLGSAATALDTPRTLRSVLPLLIALYVLPLLIVGFGWYRERTASVRTRGRGTRKRVAALEAALARARTEPSSEVVGELSNALRAVQKIAASGATDRAAVSALIADLEATAYDPRASDRPLAKALVDRAASIANSLSAAAKEAPADSAGARAVGSAIVLVAALAVPQTSAAAPSLEQTRAAYSEALATGDADKIRDRLAVVQRDFASLVEQNPGRPGLLTDWGNAALGAGDLGTAVLAYRRALALDRGNDRARKNLAWARGRLPSTLVADHSGTAIDSLFFWHRSMAPWTRHLLAAVAFALLVLLWFPWGGGRSHRVTLRRLSVLPLLVFVAMLSSALLESDHSDDAVITTDATTLRAADSPGAPSVVANPLPAGLEVTVLERRGSFTRARLADGTTGWLVATAVTSVVE